MSVGLLDLVNEHVPHVFGEHEARQERPQETGPHSLIVPEGSARRYSASAEDTTSFGSFTRCSSGHPLGTAERLRGHAATATFAAINSRRALFT